jgi:ketosteroid isomerase-like protein
MRIKTTLIAAVFGCALAALPLTAQNVVPAAEADPAAFTGTWFGSFNVTTPDGQIHRDNAVLVLQQNAGTLSGTMGSTIDQQSPLTGIQITGDEIRFHMDAAGGLDFTLRSTAGHLTGSSRGRMNAAVDVRPAPGLLPHEELVKEISEADSKLFAAFDACNVDAYASFLSPDLEFYHDKGGKTGYQFQLDSLRQRCGEGLVLRRELVPDSLIINAAPGFGAIEAGTHRFYSKEKDGTEHLDATARFAQVWTKTSGRWQLVRIISYDHE